MSASLRSSNVVRNFYLYHRRYCNLSRSITVHGECNNLASSHNLSWKLTHYRYKSQRSQTSESTQTTSSRSSGDDDGDFFGIKYFTADDIKGVSEFDEVKKQKLEEKIQQIKELEAIKASNEGFERNTTFGKVRYDRENKVDYMGQYENDSSHVLLEKRRQYILELTMSQKASAEEKGNIKDKETVPKDNLNFIDEQYFNNLRDLNDDHETKKASIDADEDLNFIDYQYFKENYSPATTSDGLPGGPVKFHFTQKWDDYRESLGSYDQENVVDFHRSPAHLIADLDKLTFSGDSPLRSVQEVAHELSLINHVEQDSEPQDDDQNDPVTDLEASDNGKDEIPKTALDYVMKMRQGKLQPEDKAYLAHLEEKFRKIGSEFRLKDTEEKKKAFDSSGKRSFREQIPKLNLLRRDELIEYLKKRVIFNERDLIALDKPNGLIVEGGEKNRKYPSLESLLPDLSKALFNEENQLYIVHRLDRDATGVLLLARSMSMVKILRDMFAERKIGKYYWTIVRGVPDPEVGIIDIPIEAGNIKGVERMVLKPECDVDFNRSIGATRGALSACTHYRILRKYGNCCMMEVKPEQGIKHQIRVHLGFGLRTPILGDHKYSYLDKMAPQKLPDDMLKRLNIRQSKVRNIPLHLHAKLYIIPEIGVNGGNISIPAHLPGFFRSNLSNLGLYKRESIVKSPIAF